MSKTYVIKNYEFGYDDQSNYVVGETIHSKYTDFKEAKTRLQQLQINAVRNIPDLKEEGFYSYGTEESLKPVNDFILQKTGQNLIDKEGEIGHLPKSLSDEDILTFMKITEMNFYRLIEFDNEPQFYALWLPYQQRYHENYEPVSEYCYFIYTQSSR